MNFKSHGGRCCGMNHVFGFMDGPTEKRLNVLDRIMERYIESYCSVSGDCDCEDCKEQWRKMRDFNALLEAVLVDQQMTAWAPELKKRGFRLVNRFFNSNSGNYCNVLHFTPHEPRGENRRPAPYKW